MEQQVEVSKEFDAKLELKDGKIAIAGNYEGKIGGAETKVFVKTDALIDFICEKIPGTIDDSFGAMLKLALSKV